MNESLIKNWNSVVGQDDLVYHLGDFAFGREDYHFTNIFRRLNGQIVFIEGNHDKLARRHRHKFYAYHNSYYETKIKGDHVTLCHYALKVWNGSHHGSYHVYGHSHGTLPDDPNSKSLDVGVDCFNFYPVEWQQIKGILDKKNFKPVDHHE